MKQILYWIAVMIGEIGYAIEATGKILRSYVAGAISRRYLIETMRYLADTIEEDTKTNSVLVDRLRGQAEQLNEPK